MITIQSNNTKKGNTANRKKNSLFRSGWLLLSAMLVFAACNKKSGNKNDKPDMQDQNQVVLTAAQLKNAGIETTQLTSKTIAAVVKLNGKIDVPPQNLISVSAPLGGYLRSTHLLPGTYVRKGERIAVMEDPQYIQLQQDYLQAKSKYYFAEMDYNRQKNLNQSQASSDKVMQQAQLEMNNQHILMKALAEKLKLIAINPAGLTADKISKSVPVYSTITGFVSKVNANVGKYLAPSDVLFELIDPADIHLNLKVYEKDVMKLTIGQKIVAYSNAAPNKKYEARIILISKDINSEGLSEVHCHFERYDRDLLPGMYMNAEVELTSGTVNALPEESIVSFEGKEYVFVEQAARTYKMVPVTIGNKENAYVGIENSAILEGKKIVTKGAYNLLMTLKNKEE